MCSDSCVFLNYFYFLPSFIRKLSVITVFDFTVRASNRFPRFSERAHVSTPAPRRTPPLIQTLSLCRLQMFCVKMDPETNKKGRGEGKQHISVFVETTLKLLPGEQEETSPVFALMPPLFLLLRLKQLPAEGKPRRRLVNLDLVVFILFDNAH